MKLVIFNLDGTLTLTDHRNHYMVRPKTHDRVYCDNWVNSEEAGSRDCILQKCTCANWAPDWNAFDEACDEDVLNKPVADMYEAIKNSNKYEMAIFTGRSESVIKKTDTWLSGNNIFYDHLYMRKPGDSRKDHLLKKEMIYNFLQEFNLELSDVAFVVDNRKQVVDMWRSLGLTCFECAEGNLDRE